MKYFTIFIYHNISYNINMPEMNTYTKRQFDPMKITIEDVDIVDIAHALSLLCQGGGHLKQFYSVGQHCINCAKEAKARNYSNRVVLAALLHDASEAYISDIIRPVKVHLTNYLEIESMIMNVILQKYYVDDLNDAEIKQWKDIDDAMLQIELKYLMPGDENLPLPQFYSTPDLDVHECKEIEETYINLVKTLEKTVI